ncbi:MAG: 50S ribosomal protein L22 [Eubacterium sp.]|nr:50S ribosomal protein L22 [Eubacterium sp.]
MAKGHRTQIKKDRNQEQRETRPFAKLRFARMSAQKAEYVLAAIRGKDVQTAQAILAYNPRYASTVIGKLLKSAIANAENNNNLDPDTLYVDECYAGKATTMKRIRPRARGMAYRIEKRTCHITIILNER